MSIAIAFTQPGNPQQNAYAERYNRTFREECLDINLFAMLEEAQIEATQWLWTYNNIRPNMAIGGITPAYKINQFKHMQQDQKILP